MSTMDSRLAAPRRFRRAVATLRGGLFRIAPARLLLLGYLTYILIGFALLCLPLAQQVPVGALDNLFVAASAVSTTGLVTVDPGTSYTLFGEIVILALIQMGGLGYMTASSFVVLAIQHRLGRMRTTTARAAFGLPPDFSVPQFLRSVVLFTFACEAIGALALWPMFRAGGVEDAGWAAIFHAVSAFCTAGFSLFATSLEAFRGDAGVNIVISVLSLIGAMGFLVVVDGWRTFTGRSRHLGFTSRVIVRITVAMIALGTVVLFLAEPSIAALSGGERLMAAFFQAMTAATTVGFDTHAVGGMGHGALMALMLLMVIGASPAGTGGGLKTTTFAVLWGLVRTVLKGRPGVQFCGREVPAPRVRSATAALACYLGVLALGVFLLLLTEAGADFTAVVFEATSAIGTVGLSMGLTGALSDLGKLIVIVLMVAGRLGVLTFGLALAAHDDSEAERADGDLML